MSRLSQGIVFATLWTALVGHVSLAAEVPSTAGGPLSTSTTQEPSEARLEEVLTEWLGQPRLTSRARRGRAALRG